MVNGHTYDATRNISNITLKYTLVDRISPFSGACSVGHIMGTQVLPRWKMSPSLSPVSDGATENPAVPFCMNSSKPTLHPQEELPGLKL